MSTSSDRKIKDVRDIWSAGVNNQQENNNPAFNKQQAQSQQQQQLEFCSDRSKHKYKTLERHLSMKKTIRRKMMRDLKEIGDASNENENQSGGFLEQIRTDQPPPANIDKPSLWKRLTKGWGTT